MARSRVERPHSGLERFVVNIPRRLALVSFAALFLCAEVASSQGLDAQAPHRSGESGPATSVTTNVLWTSADISSDGWSRSPLGPVWADESSSWTPPGTPFPSERQLPGVVQLGIAQSFPSGWTASYSLGVPNDEAIRPWSPLWLERSLWSSGSSGFGRGDWRHFLGLEYAPVRNLSLLGGIAKAGGANGSKGASLLPFGYERLRLNAGARWQTDDWGLESSFAFIPGGPNRVPSDVGTLPGLGGSGPTYLFALTLSRRF